MSSNHESTTAVFNAFIEASKALDELPRVKADLEAATQLADETEHKLRGERDQNNLLQNSLAALRADLAQREADLAQATKSNADLAKVVDLIRGALPSVPVPASTDDRPSDMPAGTVSAANTEQGSAGAARLNQDQSDARLNPEPQGQHDAGPTNTSTPMTGGERDTDPTNQNQPTATANNNTTQPHHADSPSAGGTTGQQGQGSGDREHQGEAQGVAATAGHTTQVEAGHGSLMSSHSTHTPSGISAFGPNASPEPRRPHWTKPNEQSWQSWIAQGGEPAPWMR